MPCPRNAPSSKTAIGPCSEHAAGFIGKSCHSKRVIRRIRYRSVGSKEKQGFAGQSLGQQHDHRRIAVRNREEVREIVACRAAFLRECSQRTQLRGADTSVAGDAAAITAVGFAARAAGAGLPAGPEAAPFLNTMAPARRTVVA